MAVELVGFKTLIRNGLVDLRYHLKGSARYFKNVYHNEKPQSGVGYLDFDVDCAKLVDLNH